MGKRLNPYGIIYLIRSKITGKCYVGQTTSTFKRRLKSHKDNRLYKHPRTLVGKKIKQYGWENFETFHLDTCFTNQEDLDTMECYYIDLFNSKVENGCGYNVKEGGSKGKASEKTKELLRAIAYNLMEIKPGWPKWAHLHTPENLEKTKQANIGIKRDWYKPRTTETKLKIGFSVSGEKNGMYGNIDSKSPTCKGKIKIIEVNTDNHRYSIGDIKNLNRIFESAMDVERQLKIHHSHVSRQLISKTKYCHGYKFQRTK